MGTILRLTSQFQSDYRIAWLCLSLAALALERLPQVCSGLVLCRLILYIFPKNLLDLRRPVINSNQLGELMASLKTLFCPPIRSIAFLALAACILAGASRPRCSANDTEREAPPLDDPKTETPEIQFKSYDGYDMFGKLTVPLSSGPHAVVINVQRAEASTVDIKRSNGHGGTFNYYDLYRVKLPEMNVAFFSYEGRGVRMGDKPPRYETIDWDIYNTSTLDNKIRDIVTAVQVVKKQPGIAPRRIFLMGASEGTLLEAEAASRIPDQISGLILYAVLSRNMRENFKYILTGGALITWCDYFDTDRDGKI